MVKKRPRLKNKTQREKKRINYNRRGKKELKQLRFSNCGGVIEESLQDNLPEAWGDEIEGKDHECIRVLSNNINSLGIQKGNHKEYKLKELMVEQSVDVLCLQEVNINWRRCTYYDSFYERIRCKGLDHLKHSKAYNKHENYKHFQRGGVTCASVGTFSQFVKDTGADETGLGRWTWILVQGRREVKTRIISAYQPCLHEYDKDNGFQTVYRQQSRYWQSQGVSECPIMRFREDLSKKITDWTTNGEKIILTIDVNEDVRDGNFAQMMRRVGLVSAIRRKHGNNMPPTYQLGSRPIDDIFVSPSLTVMKAGCLAFGTAPGDHRGLFIDVVERSMIGGDAVKVKHVKARRLVSTNPMVKKKFLTRFKKQMQRNHVYEQMIALERATKDSIDNHQKERYEKLDRIKKSAVACAEKKCRKFSSGEVAFVPEKVQKYGMRITLVNLLLRRKKGCLVSTKLIKRIAQKCSLDQPFQFSIDQLKELLSDSWKQYNKVKPNSIDLRFNWIDQRISEARELDQMEKVKLLTIHKRREMTVDSHRRIQFTLNKGQKGGCKMLTIPDEEDGSLQVIDDKERMERVLMETYKAKFQQANGTPFTIEPLKHIVPIDGDSAEVEEILRGEYAWPDDIHEGAKEFLKACAVPEHAQSIDPVEADITYEEFVSFWQNAKERTQSSMSGIHFGVYKSSISCEYCSSVLSNFVRIPFRTGFTPSRYKNSLNVTLPKKSGDHRPEKQRTIHLIEAGFSQAAKIIFSRKMMKRARVNKLIPEQQFARKGSKSIDAAILKVLIFDKCRLMRRKGMSYSGDLMNCYDRMSHASASLALKYLGAPQSAITSMINILHDMKHFIRTAYGDSEQFYTGSSEEPLQGGGQGNPAAPPMWLALTVIILKVVHSFEPGVEFAMAISLAVISFTAIVYVDDTDLFFYGRKNETSEELINRAQRTIDKWTNALWATGGILRPEKGWWCLVEFKWVGSKWKYVTECDESVDIMIRNNEGEVVATPQITCSKGMKTLGVFIAADGNWEDQHAYLVSKSQIWADQVAKSSLSRIDSLLGLTSTISKTWAYPLAATRFTKLQCNQIMVPVYKKVLPKMGFNQKIPKAYRFGLQRLQGLGLPDVYLLQGLAQIKTFLSHIKKGTVIGDVLEDQLETITLHLGGSAAVFDLPYDSWSIFLDDCFSRSLWQFIDKHGIVLKGQLNIPKAQRQQDQSIMDCIMQYNRNFSLYSVSELQCFNRCRVYLQLYFVSDMATGDGLYITKSVLEGKRDLSRKSQWQWPNQHRPSNSEWKEWKKMLQQVFCTNMSTRFLLAIKLGKWIRDPHQKWIWFADLDNTCLYKLIDSGRAIRFLPCVNNVTRDQRIFVEDSPMRRLPENSSHATIDYFPQSNRIRFTGSAFRSNNEDHDNTDEWQQFGKIHKEVPEILNDIFLVDNGTALANAIEQKRCRIVCDGSYHPDFETATMAVIIEDFAGIPLGRGYCRVPGPKSAQNSYRAELFGIYVALTTVEAVIKKNTVLSGQLEIHCDNLWAVNKAAFSQSKLCGINTHHYDILWALYRILQELPPEVRFFHVYGHQSSRVARTDPVVRMNIDADSLAKQYLTYCIYHPSSTVVPHVGSDEWRVYMDKKMIVDHFDKKVLDSIGEKKFFKYLTEKGELSNNQIQQINWKAIGVACARLTQAERSFVTRFASGFLPTQAYLHNLKKEESSSCPRCRGASEDRLHVLYCQHANGIINMEDAILQFLLWTSKNVLEPDIKYCFVEIFRIGRDTTFAECLPLGASEALTKAAQEQDSFGRLQFHKGRLSQRWFDIQERYMQQQFPTKKFHKHKWAGSLIYLIFHLHHELWNKRCKCVHHQVEGGKRQRLREQFREIITKEFEQGRDCVGAVDRGLFDDQTCEEILKWHEDEQRGWMHSVKAARKKFRKDTSTTMNNMRDNLSRWMNRNEAVT